MNGVGYDGELEMVGMDGGSGRNVNGKQGLSSSSGEREDGEYYYVK